MKPEDKVTADRLIAAGTTQTPLTDEEQWAVEKMLGVKNAVAADFARSIELKLTASKAREAELVAALKAAEPALWLLAAGGNLDAANKHAQVIAALANL